MAYTMRIVDRMAQGFPPVPPLCTREGVMVMPPSLPTSIHDASHQEQAGRLRADAAEADAGALAAAPAIVWMVAGSLDLAPCAGGLRCNGTPIHAGGGASSAR